MRQEVKWQGMSNAEHYADCVRLEVERKAREAAAAAAAAVVAAQNAQFMVACQMRASGRCEGCGQ